MRRKVSQTLGQLAYAFRRVGNEFQSAALVGSGDYRVRLTIRGLEREESSRVFAHIASEAADYEPPERDDELAARKESYVEATVVGAAGPTTATTILLDAFRAALAAERVEHKVTLVATVARRVEAAPEEAAA